TGVSGGPALPAPYPSISAQTDDKGSFKLVDVPAGSWAVKPVGPRVLSFNEVRIDLQPGQRQDGAGIVMTLGATVIGRLLGIHGQPLVAPPNVLLEVCGRSGDGKHTLAPAEQIAIYAQGQFVFNAKQVGDAQLRVFADKEGFAASSWVKLEEGKSLELEFRLRPFQRIVGWVVETGTHRPLAGAVVKVDPVTSGEPPVAWTADRLCDNEGRFALESLAPAQYTLSATANGFTLSKPILLSVPEQGTPPEVTVEMERAAPAK
ncbi:MAG: carboxypeptidase regulatory-like domain-containing protein, partial [Armatimonadetes bacterium]|nr:carboxypeptidase regulatory-like domain-containing protein [Armatimonadota bacterium]